MARTKFIPKPRPSQPTKRTTSSNTGRRAAWTAAIELGASNGQALVEKPGGTWELVRWPQGAGASSVGGAEAIPALTAIQKGQRESREICHGHAAVRARKKDPTDWEVFAYPKHVFMDGDTTPEIQRTLELQEEKAKTLGTTPREIAIGFFRHMISEVVGSNEGTFKIYLNISDRWRNRPVQELMLSLEALKANVYFENVDECLSTLVGRISNKESDLQTGEVVVVVDCGHSTMNVGLAEIADGPTYKVHRYEEYAAGAGAINMAVEEEVRSINRTNGAKFVDMNVWEVSEFIDDYFKPEPDSKLSTRYGFTEAEWDMIIGRARLANSALDKRRVELIRQILTEAKDKVGSGFQVLLTGRGSRSPTFRNAFRNLLENGYPTASMHEDQETHSTAVLAGLMRISDEPDILSVKEVPMSLWLRSDPDEATNEKDRRTVVRVCTQGKTTKDTLSVRDRASATHPIHYELSAAGDEPLTLDLSVFGTPIGVSDEDIIMGWNAEKFAYTDVDKVSEFGRFEQEMPQLTAVNGSKVCHVYLYVEVSRLSVKLHAVFARDGHEVKILEKTPFENAFQNGEIGEQLRKHKGVDLEVVRLKQVARPESLAVDQQEATGLGSRRPGDPGSGSSQPAESPTQQDEISVSHKQRKRNTSLLQSTQVQRRKVLSLPPGKKTALPSRMGSNPRNTEEDETESEMEM